jgi:hypothetical protein
VGFFHFFCYIRSVPDTQELEESLSRLGAWRNVSFKKEFVESLDRALEPGEAVIEFLEGLYQGGSVRGSGAGVSGLLCLTGRRIVFLMAGSRDAAPDVIPFSSIRSVEEKRNAAYSQIVFNHEGDESTLTVSGRQAGTRGFITALREAMGGKLASTV